MHWQAGPRRHGARPGFTRVVAWLLALGLLLSALPVRAWAGAPGAAPAATAAAVSGGEALPPCHGEPAQGVSGPLEDAAHPHTAAPSSGPCDCCLSCSPAAAGAPSMPVPVASALCGPPACAPVPAIQALPDGLFRPPRG